MEEKDDICLNCPYRQEKLAEMLGKLDSIFDVAFVMDEFEKMCKKDCGLY